MGEIRRFLKDDQASTAIEYAIIAAGIAVAIVAAVGGLGTKVSSTYTGLNTSLK
jgi:pilus assembly protein Flp/PilA